MCSAPAAAASTRAVISREESNIGWFSLLIPVSLAGPASVGHRAIRDLPAPRFASRLNKVMAQLHRREHNDDCLAVRIII